MSVFTAGTFDLFHAGHVRFLRRCATLGEVTVAVNSDEFVKRFKGPTVCTFEERFQVVAACRYVTSVVCNDSADLKPLVCGHDLVVIGSDWARKDYFAQTSLTQEWLDEQEIGLVYLPYTPGISTSEIRGRLQVHGGSGQPREPVRFTGDPWQSEVPVAPA